MKCSKSAHRLSQRKWGKKTNAALKGASVLKHHRGRTGSGALGRSPEGARDWVQSRQPPRDAARDDAPNGTRLWLCIREGRILNQHANAASTKHQLHTRSRHAHAKPNMYCRSTCNQSRKHTQEFWSTARAHVHHTAIKVHTRKSGHIASKPFPPEPPYPLAGSLQPKPRRTGTTKRSARLRRKTPYQRSQKANAQRKEQLVPANSPTLIATEVEGTQPRAVNCIGRAAEPVPGEIR